MLARPLCALTALAAVAAHAEDDARRRAREELERQLQQLVVKQPAKVRIDFEALDDPNYKLEDASFELDGRVLARPALDVLSSEGTHLVWEGDVTPGKHVVGARVVYSNQASVVVSDEGGYTWKVSGTNAFEVQSGIEVKVKVTPRRDGAQKDIAKRLMLRLPATPVMLAQVDDGKMPEPPVKKVAPVDAGPTPEAPAAAEKEAQAEAMRLAEEARRRKAEEAKEARRLAAEEKKRRAEEAKEARRLAAEEKKRLAKEAAEAKRLAAAGSAPPPVEPVAALPEVDAGASEVDAAQAEAAAEDAGAPVVAEVADAGVPEAAPPPAEDEGPSWLFPGIGAAALLVIVILVARRRSQPPRLDD
jgi:hypothetical protein